jgi:signal transduction histidine kinase
VDGAQDLEVESDPAKVQQILTNLFSNACKFTKNGVITVVANIGDNQIQLSVTDSGIGMTEEQQAKVFQAFVQADSKTSVNYGGTGLGLAIVSNFCDMLGGTIALTSSPGEGSRFEVSLPAAPM